jgi:hypothetical protein
MNLEDQLRDALRRQDPPEGFAERVIQNAGPLRVQFRSVPPKPRFRWLLPAVAVAAAVAVVFSVSVQHRRAQEELAGRQAIYALQLVAEGLNMAQSEVLNK